jgi:hypothetical protein
MSSSLGKESDSSDSMSRFGQSRQLWRGLSVRRHPTSSTLADSCPQYFCTVIGFTNGFLFQPVAILMLPCACPLLNALRAFLSMQALATSLSHGRMSVG